MEMRSFNVLFYHLGIEVIFSGVIAIPIKYIDLCHFEEKKLNFRLLKPIIPIF